MYIYGYFIGNLEANDSSPMKGYTLHFIALLLFGTLFQIELSTAQEAWQPVETENLPEARHENAFVKAGDKFYLIGGRGMKPTEVFDPSTGQWSSGTPTPIEISHFQAVTHEGLIYVMGGLTGNWPSETPLSNIFIYDPLIDKWMVGPEIPEHRQRGAAGVAVYDGKLYMVCGIVNGHTSGWVPWLDEFDPATNRWKELPDAPRPRDHFQAAVAGDMLVAAGGRMSGYQGQGFQATIAETDLYDFRTGQWITLPSPEGDIPTERAGTGAAAIGNEVVIIGGESGAHNVAHSETEALDVTTGRWRSLPEMHTGRHGTQLLYSEGSMYTAAGSGNRGGGPELDSLERLVLQDTEAEGDEPLVAGTLELSSEQVDFGAVRPHTTRTIQVQLSNGGGNQGIPLSYMMVTGSSEFSVDFPYELPYVLGPGKSVSFELHYTPESVNGADATLFIKRLDRGNQQPLEISLRGNN